MKGKDYYILFATAQWNYYVNSVSGAMAGAGALVKRKCNLTTGSTRMRLKNEHDEHGKITYMA